jgi:prepilin-type N-terminal cleavage/methylation domain-containing protein
MDMKDKNLLKKRSRRKKGLSLIESIIATAILAIILVSVFAIFQQGYAYMRKTRMSTTAYFLAQSKLEEFYDSSFIFEPSGQVRTDFGEASFPPPYDNYNWSATFTNHPGYTDPELAEVNVTVYWQGRTGQRSVSLITLMGNW